MLPELCNQTEAHFTATRDLVTQKMGSLDSLKALLQKKKQEKQELVGDKKYVRRAELEEARIKRLREEEEQERRAKARGTGQQQHIRS